MKIRRLGAELFHVAGRMDRAHEKATNSFSQFCNRI